MSHPSRFEYLALLGSLILVFLETVIHLITFCLRGFHPDSHIVVLGAI